MNDFFSKICIYKFFLVILLCNSKTNNIMTQITIDIANWGRVDDKTLLRVVRNAINYHIKYGFPNKTINVWQDQEQHVEMNIKIKD